MTFSYKFHHDFTYDNIKIQDGNPKAKLNQFSIVIV